MRVARHRNEAAARTRRLARQAREAAGLLHARAGPVPDSCRTRAGFRGIPSDAKVAAFSFFHMLTG
ncbi:hypothetical protein BURPSS13_P0436 [Burkholderia pseudomallei S13]|nr:hypothetical protein BURPSS13_P0436 [Burkholderia pseudomallei S13]